MRERERERDGILQHYQTIQQTIYIHRGRPSLLWMWLDCFAPLSYKTALIRATERECIPRGGGALAGQLGRCLKTIDEIGPHEDKVLFQAGQYTALSSVGILV